MVRYVRPMFLERILVTVRPVFADIVANRVIAVTGPSWDSVRELRRRVLGTEAYILRPENVPPELRYALPLAAVLGVGEEGLFERLYTAMDDDARLLFWRQFRECSEAVREFVESGDTDGAERYAFLNLLRFADAVDE